ncbi:ParB N-terminal domain-containing protein [Nocardioides humi]|uniref:ParB N-terminal domain-containing protein n=1 Tax=Nocardioides humi TaxID=449461 RepID=UPI001FE3C2AB|nr:ParB N-terminal domain-containing protein [Nocardioides humi]
MTSVGHIELDRTVESITVGRRHRVDLGDIDALAASIDREGLLQPLTVTPEGVLVCGRRRLAAIKALGWRTVNVWVRSGISDRLGQLVAEQDDNVLHKPLSQLEAAALYRELKQVMAEDAARRQAATRFSATHQPRDQSGGDGGGESPPPSSAIGKTREQAARVVTGAASYKRLEQIGWLQQVADDLAQPAALRAQVVAELECIEAGAAVNPIYQQVRQIVEKAEAERTAELDQMAQEALARVQADNSKKAKKRPIRPPRSGTRSRPGIPCGRSRCCGPSSRTGGSTTTRPSSPPR